MDTLIFFLARYLIVVPPLTLLQHVWMLQKNERVRFVIHILLSFLIAYIGAKTAGAVFDNPRPFVVGNFEPLVPHGVENGFPSMHTLVAATIAFILLGRSRALGIALIVVAILVGIGRVYAGVHHGIDVVGGFTIAALSVALSRILLSIRIKY
jgi:undecaprenyl-diphosphatase